MKGDLINGFAFLSIVPWYYYLAITNSFYMDDTTTSSLKPQLSIIQLQQGMKSQQQKQQEQTTVKDIQHTSSEYVLLQQSRSLDEIIFDDSSSSLIGIPIIPIRNDHHHHDDNDNNNINKMLKQKQHDQDNTSKNNIKMSTVYDSNENDNYNSYDDESILLLSQQQQQQQQQGNRRLHKLSSHTVRTIHRFMVCIVFHIAGVLGFMSWYYRSIKISVCTCIVNIIATLTMNLCQWPHPNESTLIPQFIWYLMTLSANTPLHLQYQVVLGLLGLVGSLGAMINIPYYDLNDGVPMLLGATALHIVFHVARAADKIEVFSLRNDTFRSIFATCTLVIMFIYHVFNEVSSIKSQPGYALTGGFSIIRAGFFASFGLLAADAFKNEADAKGLLERLVQERTHLIVQQARRLRMVEMALEASDTAIAITDKDQKIVWCNPALLRLTKKTEKEANNSNLVDVLQPDELDCNKIKQCFNERMSIEDEITVNYANIAIQVGPFVDDDSHYSSMTMIHNQVKDVSTTSDVVSGDSRYIVILKDFTEKKKRQVAEEAAQKEYLLKQAMSESCQILSHELRTPLQGIMGITSMLLDGRELQKDAEEALSLVMVSSRLLLTLINNMLDVRKCEANMMSEFECVSTDLYQPMEDAVNFCRPLGSMSNVQVDLLPSKVGDVLVSSDSLRLQQIIINLVSNSIKHSTPGSITTVKAEFMTLSEVEAKIKYSIKAGAHQDAFDIEFKDRKHKLKVVVVSVTDTGKGVDISQADRLFKKFGQLNDHCSGSLGGNTLPGQLTGTGLGLNLCSKFVHRMKGNIWANNNPNGIGACFSFYLPLISGGETHHNVNNLSTNTSLSTKPSSVISPIASSCRVLVVDDTLINLKVLDRMLKQVGVKFATCVDSGYKAMQMLENDDYNLVITDVQMPGMSGTELSESICRSTIISKKPTIVGLTAEVSKAMDDKCSKSGMIQVLHKPLTANQLKDFFDQTITSIIQKVPLPDENELFIDANKTFR